MSWEEFKAQRSSFIGGRFYKQVCRPSSGGNGEVHYGPIKQIELNNQGLTIHTEWRKKDSMFQGLPNGRWLPAANRPLVVHVESHEPEGIAKGGVKIAITEFIRFELYPRDPADDAHQ